MRSSPDGKVSNERRTLWIVLLLNAAIAAGFFVTGLVGDSSALIANGVDNLSDTAVYALSLIALSHGRTWNTWAATVRSEERRAGEGGDSTCSSRCASRH